MKWKLLCNKVRGMVKSNLRKDLEINVYLKWYYDPCRINSINNSVKMKKRWIYFDAFDLQEIKRDFP